MTNLKNQLEEPLMQKIKEIISKSIENKIELKIDENLETNIENYTISNDDFSDYVELISDLLSFSQMTMSKTPMNNYLSSFEKCDFTKADFFYYLTLENQIWKVLDENVLDKEWVDEFHFCRLENDFDDFMTDNRKKVYEYNFDKTDVWKDLEPRIKNGIGKKTPVKITTNQNWEESIKKGPPEEITFSKQYRDVFGDDDKILEIQESKQKKEPRSPYWLKRELASSIGITICGKCGTRTKIGKTEEISGVGRFGFSKCPKCGREEKWMFGHP